MDTLQLQRFSNSQVSRLARLFFARFFDNDLLNPGVDRSNNVFTALGALATPSAFLCLLFMLKYVIVIGSHYYIRLTDVSWFTALAIAVMAVATTLEWEAFFPDSRDCLILTPLPVTKGSFVGAKILALIAFLAVLAIANNGISILLFPIVSTAIPSFSLVLQRIMCQGATVVLASIFTFAAVVTLQSLCMVLLSHRTLRRFLPALQIALLVATFLMLAILPQTLGVLLQPDFPGIEKHFFLPPLWFLGLHQTLLGDPLPLWKDLAGIALHATWIAVFSCVVTYALAARKYLGGSIEAGGEAGREPSYFSQRISRILDRLLFRNPNERVTFYFTIKTLQRSPRHRLILATTLACAALALISALPSLVTVETYIRMFEANQAVLSMPFTVVLIVILGLRYSFTVPAELQANWLFRFTAGHNIAALQNGIRKAMAVSVLLPLGGLFFALYFPFFTAAEVTAASLFIFAFGVVALEVTLIDFPKVPFTCAYRSGKANLRVMWLVYFLALTTIVSMTAAWERWALVSTSRVAFSLAAFTVLYFSSTRLGRRRHRNSADLVFEEPDANRAPTLLAASD